MTLRVFHVYKSYYPDTVGGVEKLIADLSVATQALGIENHLITTTTQSSAFVEKRGAVIVHYFPKTFELSSCPVSLKMFLHFYQTIQEADVLHYHFPWPFADPLHLLLASKKPSVVTYHSDIVKQRFLKIIYEPIMHWFLKKVNVVVPTSDRYLKSSEVLKKYTEKSMVIPAAVDEKEYVRDPALIDQWKNKVGEKFLLFVGTLRYYKGLHFLIEAMKDSPYRLVIAGKGPEEKKLKEQAKKLGLTNIMFTGYISDADKTALYTLCHAVVIPSHVRTEAFCLALVEGLLFSKPLICCEVGSGTSFVNQEGETGFVVPPETPQALKEAISKLYQNPDQYQQFSLNARKRFDTFFAIEKVAKAYADLYAKLLK